MKNLLYSCLLCRKAGFTAIFALALSLLASAAPVWHAARSLPNQSGADSIKIRKISTALGQLSFELALPGVSVKSIHKKQNNSATEKVTLGMAPQRVLTGEPILPVVPVQIVIPAGLTVKKVSVRTGKKLELPGIHHIEHGNAPIPYSSTKPRIATPPNLDIYEKNTPYPPNMADFISQQKKQGVTIAIITVNPVTYYPKSGKVAGYKDCFLDITTEPDPLYKSNPNFRQVRPELFNSVENPEDLDSYKQPALPVENNQNLNGICNPADFYQYVIITSKLLRDASTDYTLRDIVSYKQSRGITATIITTEEIYTTYTGTDNQERIRNFARDAFNNWKTNYVLFGGDVNIVPIRMLFDASEGGTTIPSDLYYQCLDGSFNEDGDGFWGEPVDGTGGGDVDLMAELAVGRASAENAAEMSNFVYKTLSYAREQETIPLSRTACMVGEYLGSQFGSGAFAYAYPYLKEIHYGSSASGNVTRGFSAVQIFTVDSLDDYFGIWQPSRLITSMNSNKVNMYNHLGHAGESFVMKLYNSDIDTLTNSKPFFIYSQGCYPGDMTTDCSAEHFTTSHRSGAFAVIFNSRYGWGAYNVSDSTLDGPSQRFNRQFWDATFGESITTFGDANNDSHEDNIWNINGSYIRWCLYETNLFGDPELPLHKNVTSPYIQLHSYTLSDASGNGDGCINPGENIVLSPVLINAGAITAGNVSVMIATSDPYISISEPQASLGTVECCDMAHTATTDIPFTVSPECPTPRTITMSLTANDNHSEWTMPLTFAIYSSSQITGRVTARSTTQPIAGAAISYNGPLQGTTLTNDSGVYMFGAIDGSYTISAASSEYLPSSPVTATISSQSSTVNFELVRPHAAVSPEYLKVSLLSGAVTGRTISISNTGDAPLNYTVTSRNAGAKSVPPAEELYDATHFIDIPKGTTDVRIGNKATLPYGGPDKYGYQWIDSRHSYGPVYTWNDISTTGTLLASVSGCDDCSEQQSLSFSFPFYDSIFTSVFINSNGSISFGLGSAQHGNYPLPSITMPPFLVAPLFDDLDPAAHGDIYFKDFGDRAVFQFTDVAWHTGSERTTFQVELGHDGSITFFYRSIPGNSAHGTAGIQNGTATDGLTTAYNAGYLTSNSAVRITNRPLWLSATPSSGSIQTGMSTPLTVAFNSTNSFGGVQTAVLEIAHNDPLLTDPLRIPCTLTVDGTRHLAVNPSSYSFPTQFVNTKISMPVSLVNNGNEATTISSIECSNASFSYEVNLPLIVPPAGSIPLEVNFSSPNAGTFSGKITLTSNAENPQLAALILDGTALALPVIAVSPPHLSAATIPGGQTNRQLIVENTGSSDLTYSLHAFSTIPSLSTTLDILAWVPYTDLNQEYQHMYNAIDNFTDNFSISNSITFSASELESQLVNKEVFLVMEQEISNIPTGTGTVFAPVLQTFLNRGGTIIYCCPGYNGNTTEFLLQANLMNLSFMDYTTTGTITLEQPAHELFRNVTLPLEMKDASSYCQVLDGTSILATFNNGMVVGEKRIGLGRVITLGFDFYTEALNWARLLSNAVETGRSNVPWLSFGTASGSVPMGYSTTIPVQFSAAALDPGIYKATLEISHNAQLQTSPLVIPVTFVVSTSGGVNHSRVLSIGTAAQTIARGTTYSLEAISIGSPVASNMQGFTYRLYLK